MEDKNDFRSKVEEVLKQVKPLLNADGGDVELVDIKDKVVKLRLVGACSNCSMSAYTVKQGIERRLKELIPEIESVEAV